MPYGNGIKQIPRTTGEHRKDIDGLRSVAILSVLGFHCGARGFSGGFVGVDVFFAISGYLICGLIVRDLDKGSFSISNFYKRRCKRILPALFAVLLFVILASLLIASPFEARQIGQNMMAVAASVSNILFYFQGNYFNGGGALNPLLMTWSLAVEEQFYVAFPLLMMLLYYRNKKGLFGILAALSALSLMCSIYMEFRHPEFNFYAPFTRAWELGGGALLALYEAKRQSFILKSQWRQHVASWLGFLLVAGTVILYSPAVRFPGYEAIPPVLGSLLLLANRQGGANRLLALPPFVALGLISYSLYLWHWPLLSFAAMISPVPLSQVNRLMLMFLALIAAILSYRFVEQPFRKPSNKPNWKLLLAYGTGSACMLVLGAALYFSGGIPQRVPQLASVEQSLDLERPHTCVTMLDEKLNMDPDCFPPASSKSAIALLGDSHAEALLGELTKYAQSRDFQVVILSKPACPPLQGVTRYSLDEPVFGMQCSRFNEHVLEMVKSRPDINVVVLAGSWPMAPEDIFLPADFKGDISITSRSEHAAYLLQGIRAEIKDIEALHKKVIVVDDNPSLHFDPISMYRYADLPIRREIVDHLLNHPVQNPLVTSVARSTVLNPEAEEVRRQVLMLAQNDPDLAVIDTKSLFCSASTCLVADDGHLLYVDNNHISSFAESKVVAGIAAVQEHQFSGLGRYSETGVDVSQSH